MKIEEEAASPKLPMPHPPNRRRLSRRGPPWPARVWALPAPRRTGPTLLEKEESTMNRSTLSKLLGTAATLAAVQPTLATQRLAQTESATPSASRHIGMLVFPGMTVLDLIGPQQYFAIAPGRTTHLVWKTRDPIVSDSGVPTLPTATFIEALSIFEVAVRPRGRRRARVVRYQEADVRSQ
jgi:hypothetical protein